MKSFIKKFSRRTFLKYLTITMVLGEFLYIFKSFLARKKQSIGRIKFFLPKIMKKVSISYHSPYYIVAKNNRILVLSEVCPHLGCRLNFDKLSNHFLCPCHGSKFDIFGNWIAGPAKKNMNKPSFVKKGSQITVISSDVD